MRRHATTIDPDRALKPWGLWVSPKFSFAFSFQIYWTHSHTILFCVFSFFKIDPLTPTLRLVCPLFRWWVKDFVRCWTWGLAGIRNPTQTFLPSARLRRERARKKGRDISMTDWLVVSRNRSRNGCFRSFPNPQNTEFLANTKFQSYSLALC